MGTQIRIRNNASKQRCTLLSYAGATTMHPTELCCTPLSYAAAHWAMMQPTEESCTILSYLRCTPLSKAARYWATLHPTEQSCTMLSYAAPYWATLHTTESLCIPLSCASPCWATFLLTSRFDNTARHRKFLLKTSRNTENADSIMQVFQKIVISGDHPFKSSVFAKKSKYHFIALIWNLMIVLQVRS